MKLVEPISNLKNQLISANRWIIAGQVILVLSVLFFIIALISLTHLNKKNNLLSKPVKYTDGIQDTCIATIIFSCIMFIAAFGILTHFDIGSTTLRAARNTIDQSSLIKGNVAGNAVIAQDKDSTNYVNKISVDWNFLGSDDKQKLIDVTHNSKQIIYTPKSKIGRAYLRVGQYIDNNTKHPVNLTWTLKPYLVKASYDDENGHHNIVCRVDNKKVPEGKNQVIVKY